MGKNRERNVMLLCLSPLSENAFEKPKWEYAYKYRDETHNLQGYMTNEAPVKRVIEILNQDHGKQLDQIVTICSTKISNDIIEPGKIADESLLEVPSEKLGTMTHLAYFEEVIAHFMREKGLDYMPRIGKPITINGFSTQTSVTNAAIKAADEVMKDSENRKINLYVDFNGGPRNVAALLLGLTNLLELRGANIKEILFMDSTSEPTKIQTMESVFGFVDLAAGVNEYVNYGRMRLLDKYFRNSQDVQIRSVLHTLEDFSNNMQLCLTEYVLSNREILKRELQEYLKGNDQAEKAKRDEEEAQALMFSFVVKDIERGCRQLLAGDLPEMISWCVEREFIQQAIVFYREHMPEYFWNKGILQPNEEERVQFLQWWNKEGNDKSQFMNKAACWLNEYLLEKWNADVTSESEDSDSEEEYEIYRITGKDSGNAEKKVEGVLEGLKNRSIRSCLEMDQLKQVLMEYYMIQEQGADRVRSIVELGDEGRLWEYEEICAALKLAAGRLCSMKFAHEPGGEALESGIFVNFTNHKMSKWSEKQKKEAGRYGEIVDIPFPNVAPDWTEKEIEQTAEHCYQKIMDCHPKAVLCQGEFTLAFSVAKKLRRSGVKVLAACSERQVTEGKKGEKISVFNFVRFREYR